MIIMEIKTETRKTKMDMLRAKREIVLGRENKSFYQMKFMSVNVNVQQQRIAMGSFYGVCRVCESCYMGFSCFLGRSTQNISSLL